MGNEVRTASIIGHLATLRLAEQHSQIRKPEFFHCQLVLRVREHETLVIHQTNPCLTALKAAQLSGIHDCLREPLPVEHDSQHTDFLPLNFSAFTDGARIDQDNFSQKS